MNRRTFLLGLAGGLVIPAVQANDVLIPGGLGAGGAPGVSPGQEIRPYREVELVYADRNRVLYGLSFSCPHCRAYDALMSGWGASLPAGYLTYERLPLVFDKPSMMGAAVYYAYRREVGGDFGALNAFVERAFRLIQDEKGDMLDPALWRKAAGRSINIKSAQEDAVQAARKTVEYKIKHSPSLIVGGRYIATPNDAGGREDLFVQLANGLASMVLADLGYRA